jgi:hypothetical protein
LLQSHPGNGCPFDVLRQPVGSLLLDEVELSAPTAPMYSAQGGQTPKVAPFSLSFFIEIGSIHRRKRWCQFSPAFTHPVFTTIHPGTAL